MQKNHPPKHSQLPNPAWDIRPSPQSSYPHASCSSSQSLAPPRHALLIEDPPTLDSVGYPGLADRATGSLCIALRCRGKCRRGRTNRVGRLALRGGTECRK